MSFKNVLRGARLCFFYVGPLPKKFADREEEGEKIGKRGGVGEIRRDSRSAGEKSEKEEGSGERVAGSHVASRTPTSIRGSFPLPYLGRKEFTNLRWLA